MAPGAYTGGNTGHIMHPPNIYSPPPQPPTWLKAVEGMGAQQLLFGVSLQGDICIEFQIIYTFSSKLQCKYID